MKYQDQDFKNTYTKHQIKKIEIKKYLIFHKIVMSSKRTI